MNGGPTCELVFFGEPWAAVEEWRQVPTPTDGQCFRCKAPIVFGDQGMFLVVEHDRATTVWRPVHRGCEEEDRNVPCVEG